MKQRLGAIFCVILGAVLIGTGLTNTSTGTVGALPVDCTGGNIGIQVVGCPTGQIAFTKTVQGTDPNPPSSWTVRVTSTCDDPNTGLPVNQLVQVPSGGTANTGDLFVYTDTTHSTVCSYAYVEDPLPANCTSVFDPASRQGVPIRVGLAVSVTNTCNRQTTTPPPPPTSTTAAPTPTPTSTVITDTFGPTPTTTSTTQPISNTGPREQVNASVWIGVALCVLGLVLLVAGRARRGGTHLS
jgi:hypothetical protein